MPLSKKIQRRNEKERAEFWSMVAVVVGLVTLIVLVSWVNKGLPPQMW